jgi:hypothetical protein
MSIKPILAICCDEPECCAAVLGYCVEPVLGYCVEPFDLPTLLTNARAHSWWVSDDCSRAICPEHRADRESIAPDDGDDDD